jgi:hypothetical protein
MTIDMALMGDGVEIQCDVSDEPEGARRYVLQVPARAVPRAQALINDLLNSQYRASLPATNEDLGASLVAFRRLLEQMN